MKWRNSISNNIRSFRPARQNAIDQHIQSNNIMMKNIFLFSIAILLNITAFAQQEPKLDTIYMLGQKKLVVQVKSIYRTDVKYEDTTTGKVKSMKTKNIQKIIFDSGRKEVFNKPLVESIEKNDWRNVVLTRNKKSVKDLYELGKVKGKSSANNRTIKSAERTATIRMKKRAANKGGVMILVTREESQGGFGEVPTFYIEGIAYSFEPPEDQEEE